MLRALLLIEVDIEAATADLGPRALGGNAGQVKGVGALRSPAPGMSNESVPAPGCSRLGAETVWVQNRLP